MIARQDGEAIFFIMPKYPLYIYIYVLKDMSDVNLECFDLSLKLQEIFYLIFCAYLSVYQIKRFFIPCVLYSRSLC